MTGQLGPASFNSLPLAPIAVKQIRSRDVKINQVIYLTSMDELRDQDNIQQAFCGSCGRPIAAKRPECLYCGAATDANAVSTAAAGRDKSDLRFANKIEPAEPHLSGYNIIATGGRFDTYASELLTKEFSIDPQRLPRLFECGTPMPLIRVPDETSAIFAAERLEYIGIDTSIVDDRELLIDRPPIRIASLEMQDETFAFVDFNTRSRSVHDVRSITLVVEGRLFNSRFDSSLKRTGKGTRERLDETVESDDVTVIDIYSNEQPAGYRIRSVGFDFSCLGVERSLIAAENVDRLLSAFANRYALSVDRRYNEFRSAFDAAWPLETTRGAGGLTRANLGAVRFDRSETVTNEMQFLRYSRWVNLGR